MAKKPSAEDRAAAEELLTTMPAGFPKTDPAGVRAYCVPCKEIREVHMPRNITMKNGRLAVTGDCPVCGAKVFALHGEEPMKYQTIDITAIVDQWRPRGESR